MQQARPRIEVGDVREPARDVHVVGQVGTDALAQHEARTAAGTHLLHPHQVPVRVQLQDEEVGIAGGVQFQHRRSGIEVKTFGEPTRHQQVAVAVDGMLQLLLVAVARRGGAQLPGPDQVARRVQFGHEHVRVAHRGQLRGAGAGVHVHRALEHAGEGDVPRVVQHQAVPDLIAHIADLPRPAQGAIGIDLHDEDVGATHGDQFLHTGAGVHVRRAKKVAADVAVPGRVHVQPEEAHGAGTAQFHGPHEVAVGIHLLQVAGLLAVGVQVGVHPEGGVRVKVDVAFEPAGRDHVAHGVGLHVLTAGVAQVGAEDLDPVHPVEDRALGGCEVRGKDQTGEREQVLHAPKKGPTTSERKANAFGNTLGTLSANAFPGPSSC